MSTFHKLKRATAVAAGVAALCAAIPVVAGQCPAGQIGSNELTDHPTAPKGVSDKVVGSIDLGAELGVAGRDLRLRRLVVQPGGVVPFQTGDHYYAQGRNSRIRQQLPNADRPSSRRDGERDRGSRTLLGQSRQIRRGVTLR